MRTLLGKSGLVVLPHEQAPDVMYVALPRAPANPEDDPHFPDHQVVLYIRLEALSPDLKAKVLQELRADVPST